MKASQLRPSDLGRKIRVADATFTITGTWIGAAGRTPDKVHKIDSLEGVLNGLEARIKVEPGELFSRARTVTVTVNSMRLELDANSVVEYVGAEPRYDETEES